MQTDSSVEEIDSDPPPKKIVRKECTVCGKRVLDRRNLVRHMRHVHCIEPSVRKPNLKCSFNEDCTFLCASSELLRNHLRLAHNFKVERRILTFPSKAEFDKWKVEEEVLTNARYVAYTGTKSKSSGKVFYLRCHRSGSVQSESYERKRARPGKGYTQCGAICPSTIRVSELANGTIQAMYYPDHLGHSLDDESVRYMKLSAIERQEILEKLAKGEPVGKIVTDARKRKGNRLSRLNFLQRRDVYNLKKKVIYLEKDDEQDAKMVHAWIKGLNIGSEDKTPIVYYSPLNKYKDYTLILIHDVQKEVFKRVFDGGIIYVKTKKGKPNLDFNLTAVNIVSATGEGFPIAFCISQKAEYITLYTLYHTMFRIFGKITTKFFVSDNLTQSYLAWKNVMGESEYQMICIFDLESYWGQKLTQHRVPVYKQKSATASLKCLLYELDKDKFEEEMDKTLKVWGEDRSMKSFSCYFQKQYARKCKEWAGCFRIHLDPNHTIDVYLEAINGILDAIYVESYTGLRNSLNFSLAYVRDSCMVNLIEWEGDVRLEKIQATEKTHIEGLEITNIRTNGSEWVYTENDFDYVVKKVVNDCKKECGIYCSVCDVCVHQYSCVCKDYVFDFNICKHIHAARMAMARADEAREKMKQLEMEETEKMDATNKKETKGKKEKKEKKGKRKRGEKVEKRKKSRKKVSPIGCKSSTVWKPDLELVSEFEAPGGILSMAASDNILYTCSTDQSIQSWDLNAMKNAGKVSTFLFQPQKLYVDKATKLLWAGDSQGNVAKFEEGEECGKFELVEEIWDLMVTSAPNLVYTARDRDVVVSELITNNGRPRVMIKGTFQGRSPFCIAGNNFCFMDRDGRNIIVHENSVEQKFPRLKEIVASELIVNALTPATGDAVYSGGYDSTVKKWDLKSSNCLGSVNLGCCINALSCLSENEVYVAKSDGIVSKVGL